MLIAIKTRSVTKLLTLNSKKEQIILNIPKSEWIVIEDINSLDLVLNKEEILADGGEVFASLWRSDPPFGEKTSFIRSGFNTSIVATFAEIKTVSKDAIAELSKEASNSYDTIMQDVEMSEYIESIEVLTEKVTNKIAGYKTAYLAKRIGRDEYEIAISEAYGVYLKSVQANADEYILDVFQDEIIVTASKRK